MMLFIIGNVSVRSRFHFTRHRVPFSPSAAFIPPCHNAPLIHHVRSLRVSGIETQKWQYYPWDKSTLVTIKASWIASSHRTWILWPCFFKKRGTSRLEPESESKICKVSPEDMDFNASLTLTKGTGQRNGVKSIKIIMNLLWTNLGYYPKLPLKLQANCSVAALVGIIRRNKGSACVNWRFWLNVNLLSLVLSLWCCWLAPPKALRTMIYPI